MTRKTPPPAPAEAAAPVAHPLPSEGGCYEIEADELRQVAAPTAPDIANAPLLEAPLTEA